LANLDECNLHTEYGRIYVSNTATSSQTWITQASSELRSIFGLHSFVPAIELALDEQLIRTAAVRLMEQRLGVPVNSDAPTKTTFRVTCKRIDKTFVHPAQQFARQMGGQLLQCFRNLAVDLHQPQHTLCIELRTGKALLYFAEDEQRAAGGFPRGTNGRALAMLSGGIDSPVAMWQAMRRGLELEAIHFHSYPYTSEQAKTKVIDLAQQLSSYHGGKLRLHLLPFTKIQEYLRANVQERLWVTVMRRTMVRIASLVAVQRQLQAIVSGDSLGQVASQTLSALTLTDEGSTIPILRPLLMQDKQEIIDLAERIGTLAISQQPFDDCCTLFVPKHPTTNPNRNVVFETERRMSRLELLIDEAIQACELIEVTAKSTDLLRPEGQGLHSLL
jgi:thiamine biosynthesis protein ThiI